ncbi:hypothetical protein IWZ01DRAFT_523927 [Phyllosticta capitalensis]
MRYSSAIPLVFAGLTALAAAAENAFIVATSGFNPTAGKDTTLQWTPTAGKTVTLKLRQGASSNLGSGTTIADHALTFLPPPPCFPHTLLRFRRFTNTLDSKDCSNGPAANIPNDGSYTWSVPSNTVRGTDYTVEIINDDDTSETNFYPYFTIESTVVVSAASSSAAASSTESAAKTSSAGKSSKTDASVTALDVSSTASASATKSGSASSTMSTATASKSSASASESNAASSPTGSAPTSGASSIARGGVAALVVAAAGFVAAMW